MAYTRGGSEGQGGIQYLRLQRASSRSDIFPKMIAMQKNLKARNFAVFRIAGAGLPNKRKLVCELENWGAGGLENGNRLIEGYGEVFLEHMELSLLPLIWRGADATGAGSAEAGELSPLVRRLEPDVVPVSGVAFPVRLGALGNGYAVFLGNSMDLGSDAIIEQHIRSCQVMMDLLALDEKRSVPAESLSEREISCLQLAGDGRISEEIAEILGLSVHTVNAYLGSATIKLDSVNRIQAIAKAIRLGYIN
ncbi:helix-turn-helix transcriptional regulator [Rhizobium sp. LC145]|jgi:DNA-binding CsgD family transcriptional regulator|uniref:transcriptional regulator VisR n=1 Tax=Rhizobium sp. LC145 TaxID=1120688 RepID=UPI00062A2DA0|nr:helix-turn-helix transcriptional regulator [Rhizobium sp. LC145]KKX31968.1 LuxR family transcriptional regulator [Rhizobium sp. LC145]TKT58997.1 helix-turn-helix transcriptional regulator [Rhizobiaceae bacterium LC148]